MKLELNGLVVDCVIGERPDERTRLQRLRLDVRLEIDETAARTDALADTVDYAALTAAIRSALTAAKCQMIERAAKLALDVCLADARAKSATVRVTKSGAIPDLESATIELSGEKR